MSSFAAEMLEGITSFRALRTKPVDQGIWEKVSSKLFYHQSTFEDAAGYEKLAERFKELDKQFNVGGRRLYYLSTSPSEFAPIITNLGNAGLGNIDPFSPKAWRRIIVEKPFGRDLATAKQLNQDVSRVFDESQVFRIDHYLGKQTVQNMLVFRFANGLFEPGVAESGIITSIMYADHGERADRRGGARAVLRDVGGDAGHGAESFDAVDDADGDGAAGGAGCQRDS